MKRKVLVVFGTRPEAIKLAPVIAALRARLAVRVCVTAQHRQMLDQVLRVFRLRPHDDLDLMRSKQDLFGLTSRVLLAVRPVIEAYRPHAVVVQGDTTTTLAGALAAYYLRVPVAHVEAGLRTGDKHRPFPEEINRRLTTHLADWHFAPTPWARDNLLREAVPAERIFVTGNTGIDALLSIAGRLESGHMKARLPAALAPALDGRRIVLVTGHRRESFGTGFENICRALRVIAERHPDVAIVYPVHLNPNVHGPVYRYLGTVRNVYLTEPLEYVPFVAVMRRAHVIVTDSGGVQEEAPSLGKPVLVMREKTERPEGVDAGVARLVGADADRIVAAVEELIGDERAYAAMSRRQNPYGDGQAAPRIAAILDQVLGVGAPEESIASTALTGSGPIGKKTG